MKTREDVEELKRNWRRDPIWDIEDTEGFEEYREELLEFRKSCETYWEAIRQKETEEDRQEAEKLGLPGIYALVKQIQGLQKRHDEAMRCLLNNDSSGAYRSLRGD